MQLRFIPDPSVMEVMFHSGNIPGRWLPMHEQVETIAYTSKYPGFRFVRRSWNVRFCGVTATK